MTRSLNSLATLVSASNKEPGMVFQARLIPGHVVISGSVYRGGQRISHGDIVGGVQLAQRYVDLPLRKLDKARVSQVLRDMRSELRAKRKLIQ